MSIFNIARFNAQSLAEVNNSTLYDEKSFYGKFTKDIQEAKEEIIIESPYITRERMKLLWPIFEKLLQKGIKIYVMTRSPKEHDFKLADQAESEIRNFETCGVQTLICKGHNHRKLAIIDRKILWEGSLNILSQRNSREIMRRIESRKLTEEMFRFLKYDKMGVF